MKKLNVLGLIHDKTCYPRCVDARECRTLTSFIFQPFPEDDDDDRISFELPRFVPLKETPVLDLSDSDDPSNLFSTVKKSLTRRAISFTHGRL